ncbi:MAG: matrixin family metalloprotease [Paraclostridium sp.]
MRKKLSKILAISLVSIGMMTTISSAYVLYSQGSTSASISIKNRCSYSNVFKNSLSAWNATPTKAYIKEVVNSNTYAIDGVYGDEWYGTYTPTKLQNIISGRATEFNIKLNRRLLVDKSDNFRQSVLVHELGHALCLGDNPPQTQSIMRYDRNRNTMIKPQQDDINGVNAAY